jgi:hypothetical protein
MAAAICQIYHRQLNPLVLDALLNKRMPDDSAASGNPLWLHVAVHELNLIGADEFTRTEYDFTGKPEERLRKLLISVVEEMPAQIEDIYQQMELFFHQIEARDTKRAAQYIAKLEEPSETLYRAVEILRDHIFENPGVECSRLR